MNKKKSVVLSRFLCYMTIINAKFEDEEHHFKCHILPIRFDYNATSKCQYRKIALVIHVKIC